METEYYLVGKDYGWNQEKFLDPLMKIGGCAAVTACDSCIYFSRYFGMKSLYPFDSREITETDYKSFAGIMKRYLHPRWGGIDKIETYINGLKRYLDSIGYDGLRLRGLAGETDREEAEAVLKRQIDRRIPVPCLVLKHKDSRFEDFAWHWFMITGYRKPEASDGGLEIKAVSYGEWQWLDFDALWDTGYDQKGGLVIYNPD